MKTDDQGGYVDQLYLSQLWFNPYQQPTEAFHCGYLSDIGRNRDNGICSHDTVAKGPWLIAIWVHVINKRREAFPIGIGVDISNKRKYSFQIKMLNEYSIFSIM